MQRNENKYQNQLIIDFRSETWSKSTHSLGEKWNATHPKKTCFALSGKEFLEEPGSLSPEDQAPMRIYIIGHGSKTLPDVIRNDNDDESYHYKDIAKALATYINNNRNVVISLFVCEAAGSENLVQHNSFAANLHFWLAKELGRDNPVIARNLVVSTEMYFGKKFTLERDYPIESYYHIKNTALDQTLSEAARRIAWDEVFSILKSKQPGSKVIFTLQDNQQVMMDGYVVSWRQKLLDYLHKAAGNFLNRYEKKLLNEWFSDFPNKTNEEIFAIMEKELKLHGSVLAPRFFSTFREKTSLQRDLELFLDAGKQFIFSEHTIPVTPTGKGSPFSNDNLAEYDQGDSPVFDESKLSDMLDEIEQEVDAIFNGLQETTNRENEDIKTKSFKF